MTVAGIGAGTGALTRGWRPLRVLGGTSAFSLALPDGHPTPNHLYAPRAVLLDPDPARGTVRVVAADTGNHRVMVWPDLPHADGADCAAVLGQPDPHSEGPQAGGRGPGRGLNLPTGLAVLPGPGPDPAAGRLLLVADAWNHRVLGYDVLGYDVLGHGATPDRDDPAPVWVFGQDGPDAIEPNRGGEPDASSFYWPFGLLVHDGWLWVADTGNRRVLGWRLTGGPPAGAADVVLGQPSPTDRGENRGGPVGPDTFRWPHGLAVTGTVGDQVLWVADGGNHRVLGWRLPVDRDRPADVVLGQGGFDTAREQPHVPQGPAKLRFPYAVTAAGDQLVVADTANNRVLLWDPVPGPAPAAGAPATGVLGQHDFAAAGENRWTSVLADTVCWPYGLSAVPRPGGGQVLAIADSGNNRVVLWERPP